MLRVANRRSIRYGVWPMNDVHATRTVGPSRPFVRGALLLWVVALPAALLVCLALEPLIVNLVTYRIETIQVPRSAAPLLVPALLCIVAAATWRARRRDPGLCVSGAGVTPRWVDVLMLFAAEAILAWWLVTKAPSFLDVCAAFVTLGWAVARLARPLVFPAGGVLERSAPLLLAAGVISATIWHTLEQVRFWEHFLLGYADFGFFTTELEHCLPWKEVGAARFADTRLGYHAVWLFYGLAPFYAAFRSPIFLMVVGPLALNLAAVPFYQLARARSGSAAVGLIVGLAWLLLPSITRLPYSNTYGFQSIYLAVPFLAWTFSLALRGRWRAAHWCLALALLCEETVCGVALGWGAYLAVFSGRRRDGVIIMATAVAYLLVCTVLIIPLFTPSSQYTRLMLFGDLSAGGIMDRLTRPRIIWYLLALAAPLSPALWRCPRLLVAVLPTLLLVLLMHQDDYLNIKYWHQTSMLPVLFAAAVIGATLPWHYNGRAANGAPASVTPMALCGAGPALGLLVCVLLFHQWMGASPVAQSQRVYAADARLNTPDPRLDTVKRLRELVPMETTHVIATERLAAHFTDFRTVTPAPQARLSAPTGATLLLVDRSDAWDKVVMEGGTAAFLQSAADAGYRLLFEDGPIVALWFDPANLPRGSARP